jgi:hypothetical protein
VANPIQPLNLGAPPTLFARLNPRAHVCRTRLHKRHQQLPHISQKTHISIQRYDHKDPAQCEAIQENRQYLAGETSDAFTVSGLFNS